MVLAEQQHGLPNCRRGEFIHKTSSPRLMRKSRPLCFIQSLSR